MIRLSILICALFICIHLPAQSIPTPKEHFGFNIGDDYMLATYTQTEAYFKKLATSDRVKLVDIGLTEEGRHQYQLIVTSPENHKKLDRYKEISVKLARAEGITEEQARAMASEGKAIVWIDGGLHATEVVGTHQLIETLYQIVSRNDAETMRILDKVVILFTHANPDGQELVSNWYMREPKPEKRSMEFLPRLYQKYIGHDNNRDFFIMNMKETQNMGRQLFVEWIPQIMYNHHQAGPAGSVLAGPPYRDPFNYVFDPLMITGIDAVGAAMVNRLNAENKPGYTRLGGSVFSTWYNGGLRTTTHFHNMIGLLTEIVGGPTPSDIPVVPSRLVPNNNTPFPVPPQKWKFRQSIDYSVSLNYAVLDYASRNSDQLLYNIYRMGKNSIERGNTDYWTPYPSKIEVISTAFKNRPKKKDAPAADMFGFNAPGIPIKYYDSLFRVPAQRDARGYIIPSDQPDFPTAVKFVNALIKTGIRIEKAKADFMVNKKKYPAGSYIVKNNQAFRPHILDMFEPQDHPNDFQYPGGPPVRPYDAAGWTLAFQMGVQFDRYIENFDGPFELIPYGELQNPTGKIENGAVAGYLINAKANNAFALVNDLLKEGQEVYRLPEGLAKNNNMPAGSFYVPLKAKAKLIVEKNATELGLTVTGVSKTPGDALAKVSKPRIALWDTYGGSMPAGWVKWLMEQYHFTADIIYAKDIDAGELKKKYDVIVFVTRAIPKMGKETTDEWGFARKDPKEEEIPTEFRSHLGHITVEKSIPQLKTFLEAGGKIVTIGTSANLAYHLNLPVKDALTEIYQGNERSLPSDKYYVPGSLLRVQMDSTQSATWGMAAKTDVYFDNSPVFKLAPEAIVQGKIKPLAWFGDENPLRSGWAWGANYLKGGVVAFEAAVGKGKLYSFSPEITFRAQAQGTFKLLFNELYFVDEVPHKVKLDEKR
ncbi:MAG: peptidase [Bacteroidetes bacterium]|nr:peptidase [Bacteroidota bacterium]MBS1541641.1 peptidase [Bacteroidota bacterium]